MTLPTTPRVYYSGEVVYMPKHKDKDGTAISNAAKGILYKPYYVPVNIPIIHLMFFKTSFVGTTHYTWSDAVNSAAWGPWAARCAWASTVNAHPVSDADGDAHDVHIVIRCFRNTWDLEFYQMAWFYKDGADYKSFLDSDNNRYIGKLDGSGGKLAMASDPIVGTAKVHHEINFTTEFGWAPT